jgi:hypothetical protein
MTTPGSHENLPQGGAPQGEPGWGPPPPPPPGQGYGSAPQGYGSAPQGYGSAPQGYGSAPQGYGSGDVPGHGPTATYSGSPAGNGSRPGMVTAAGVIGIAWGVLGALIALLLMLGAFALGAALIGLILLVALALYVGLVIAGVQALQGKSPRLLLLLSYVAIGVSLLQLIASLVASGGNAFSGIVGIIIPGVIVFLLMQAQSRQYYASRGISY